MASLIERQVDPVNAKYYQKMVGNFNSIQTRSKDAGLLNETGMLEVEQLARLQDYFIELYSR